MSITGSIAVHFPAQDQPSMVAISNDGKTDMVVAGRLIPPGETAHFEDRNVPLALRPASAPAAQAPAAEPADPLQWLQGESVNIVKEALPTLEEDQLVALCRLEEETQRPRITLLAAIGEEQLRRASDSD